MSSDTPTEGRCNAETRDGGYCENHPVTGADRCRMHGGQSPGGAGPPGNQNARTHGLHADPANVLDDLAEADPDAYEWILSKYDSYLADAPFDDGSAKADQLKQVATREYAIWKATGFQLKGGIIRRDGDDGIEESAVNLPLDRMERTITRRLKELGVLDSPDAVAADAEAGKVQALREMMGGLDARDAPASDRSTGQEEDSE